MSKKTNKTNHVLSLLSTGADDAAADSGADTAAGKNPSENTEKPAAAVSVVKSGEDDVANKIKESLENEFKEAQEAEAKAAAAEQTQATTEEKTQEAEAPKATAKSAQPNTEEQPNTEATAEAQATQENTQTAQAAQPETAAQAQTAQPEAQAAPQTETDDNFVTVNIMERLVDDQYERYMEQFRNCTCDRCKADVRALTLTKLPAKYVVVDKNAVSPLLNFYTVKYQALVTIAVTRACMKVEENPNHKIK